MKNRYLKVRVSEDFLLKIHSLNKNVSDYVRGLIEKDLKEVQSEAINFAEVIAKIESTDISKIAESVANLEAKLEGRLTTSEEVLKYLRRTLFETTRGNILMEEFAKKRIVNPTEYSDFLKKVEQRLRDIAGERR